MGKRRILVTGAAGFIGSNLCEKLLSQGHSVLAVDNLSTGSKSNIEHLLAIKDFEFVEHDITQRYLADVNQIYNLACPSSQVSHIARPIETIKTVIEGTLNMLEMAQHNGATILEASTSKIYGNTHAGAISEATTGIINMQSKSAAYIESKRVAETIMSSYLRKHGTDIRIARIFNTYGPNMWQDDNRIISMVIARALTGRNITIYNNALQYRNPCYVDDVVEGLIALMNTTPDGELSRRGHDHNISISISSHELAHPDHCRSNKQLGELIHQPINIGSPERLTIKDLVEKIIVMTGSKSQVKYMNLSNNNVGHCTPDIELAERLLGWQPYTSLEVGLARTISYFESKLSGSNQGYPFRSWVEMA